MPDQPTILYIEDNLDNQRLVQRILTARGYNVLVADDGPTGLAMAREATLMLVLVDMYIPGLDGYETTTRLRSLPHLANTPIVAITADSTPNVRERALVAGCDGYLSKPIDVQQLPQQVAEFIGGKREFVPPVVETAVLREYTHKLVERLEYRVRELSAANAELQELDRLKSQFLSTLSHELRTPLTSMIGYLDLFERGTLGPLTDVQQEAVDILLRNSETLSRHLNNLLYLQEVRSTQLDLAHTDLNDLLKPIMDEAHQKAIQADIHLEISLAKTTPLRIDAKAIGLVVRNLLDNACKFTPRNGYIRVDIQDEPSRVLLRIQDTGCGIPREAREKIFLPFYQIDSSLARPYPGSGLGLAIVRHVVEAHGGQVTVRSTLGKGSTFTVMLPRTEE